MKQGTMFNTLEHYYSEHFLMKKVWLQSCSILLVEN